MEARQRRIPIYFHILGLRNQDAEPWAGGWRGGAGNESQSGRAQTGRQIFNLGYRFFGFPPFRTLENR